MSATCTHAHTDAHPMAMILDTKKMLVDTFTHKSSITNNYVFCSAVC